MFNLQGRLCQNFGRKSRSLVSGPGIGEMSVTKTGFASVFGEFRGGSCHGVVVRYSTGKFVASCATKLTNVFSAPQVEALAARTGTILAMERGYQNVVFERDALQIVTALRNHSIDRSVIGPVVEDIKSLLTQITGEGFTIFVVLLMVWLIV